MSALKRSTTAACLLAMCGLLAASISTAEDKHKHSSASAAFGRGLNTATPGNTLNHVILPTVIDVNAGGVVNFGIAGFHDIIVFKPGVDRDDLDAFIPPSGVYVFPSDPSVPFPPSQAILSQHVYYRGLNPAGGPLNTPVTANPSNTLNRSEPVSFLETGLYLVICNIRTHLLDGMYAYVRVKKDD